MRVITLTKTAQLTNKSPSEFARIEDREVADAFDIECAEILFEYEFKREDERFALMMGQSILTGMNEQRPLREITSSSDIGDQSW